MKLKTSLQLSALLAFLLIGLGLAANAESLQTRHVFDVVAKGQVQMVGHLPSNQVLQLDVMLPVNDPAGLKAFADAVSNPKSPSYRKFLTPDQFSATFGPSHQDYDATVRFLQANGFTVVGGSWKQMDVQVKAPVSAIEATFNVQINTYQHPTEDRTFYSPDREPSTALPFALWHISGLDNFSTPKPLYSRRSDVAAARGIAPEQVSPLASTGSGPGKSYLGSDMRAAYLPNVGSYYSGQGQYVGLLEFYGTNLTDLHTYYLNVGQILHVPIQLYSTDGTPVQCIYAKYDHWCDDTEQTLDMTQALGVAPYLEGLTMFIGSTDSSIIGAMTVSDINSFSCSWAWHVPDPATLEPLFQRMASQGQSFFTAAGDSGNWAYDYYVYPADDPYVISVGGTDLVTTGAAANWASETAWEYSGGGVAPDYDGIAADKLLIPNYQSEPGDDSTLESYVVNASNYGSSVYRNGPDVSANANYTYYVCADMKPCTENEYGGTSFAAPIWAAVAAEIDQWTANNSQPNVGFMNPTIYYFNSVYPYLGAPGVYSGEPNLISTGSGAFHDVASGGQYDGFPAVTGYDLVTGWGSPRVGLFYYFAGFCDWFTDVCI
jgi:kumamolisin